MICPFCNKEEVHKSSNGDWYCPSCHNGVGSSRRVPLIQTTGYITNSNKDLAIECLKEVRKQCYIGEVYLGNRKIENIEATYPLCFARIEDVVSFIDNTIKELESK